MSQTATLTVNTTLKTGTLSKLLSIRENVVLTLSGCSAYGYGDIRLAIILDGSLLASCNSFNSNYVGSLNLNTNELIAAFVGRGDQSQRNLTWLLFTATEATIINCRLPIQNNKYDPDTMDEPTPVEQVLAWAEAYTQAECDARYVQKSEDLAAARWVNGRWYHYIASTGLWYPDVAVIGEGGAPVLTLGQGVAL
jgi:hypothetical protein